MEANNTKSSFRRVIVGSLLLLIVMAIGIAAMYIKQGNNIKTDTALREAQVKKGPTVKVAIASTGLESKELVLIGEALPYQNVTLYAKTSGYVEKILVDKGDKVREGQVMATIISPETDQAYRSALADLENKKKVLKRNETLLAKQYISQEDKDLSQTAVDMAEANVKSLSEQQSYKVIRAPFDGTVTARFVDQGSLVQNATGSQTSALPIVTVAQLNVLRIYIYVDQKYANFVKDGYPVTLTMADNPQFKMNASVTRTTETVDVRTRMMTVEVDVPNTQDSIVSGSYLEVHVHMPGSNKLKIPSEALVVRGSKYFVPVVDDSSRVHYTEIHISDNTGTMLSVTAGIKEGDHVALNLGDAITDGQKITVIQ